MEASATLYISDKDGAEWAESEGGKVVVQRSDGDEVRLGVRLGEEDADAATIFLTVAEAGRLAHMLGAAVLANEAAAHEAAKYSA